MTGTFVRSRALLLTSIAVLSFAPLEGALARDNKQFAGKKCTCSCVLPGNSQERLVTLDAIGHCFNYNRKSCSFEIYADGAYLLRTGQLMNCARDKDAEAVGPGGATTRSPGNPPTSRPGTSPRPDAPAPAKPRP